MKKKKNPKESTEQVKHKKNKCSSGVTAAKSPFPLWESQSTSLPRMPSNTVLISRPALETAQILIWSYSSVFLPPMYTTIRTSVFSFVGALKDLSYIP